MNWRRLIGLSLIAIGGFNNLYERIVFGHVHDYWRFLSTNIYNNLNDWLIAIGLIIIIWEVWKKK